MTGKDIESRVRILLNDADMVRWPVAELIMWINDACHHIVGLRPDACVKRADLELVEGSRQSIANLTPKPIRLLKVTHNAPHGRAVRIVDREQLDTTIPDWHSETASTTIRNYTFDNREPLTFFVFPPAGEGAKLSVMYSSLPVTITEGNMNTEHVSLDDSFIDVIVNYVLYRAYSKDSETTGNVERAAAYRSAVESALATKTKADAIYSPNYNETAGRPTLASQNGGL